MKKTIFLKKRAAMEMSVGTIVTIVLLMSVLVLGIFLVQRIFTSSTTSIELIDQAIQSEINSLFAKEGKKVVIYPPAKEISIKKGESGGFGLSIKNKEATDGVFSYEVNTDSLGTNCQMNLADAENLIILRKTGQNINLVSGSYMEDAILVKFKIPESAPLCDIAYNLEVKKDGKTYVTTFIDLEII